MDILVNLAIAYFLIAFISTVVVFKMAVKAVRETPPAQENVFTLTFKEWGPVKLMLYSIQIGMSWPKLFVMTVFFTYKGVKRALK